MPAKGWQVQAHLLGKVKKGTKSGTTCWHLRAKPNGRSIRGPRRATKAAADTDLAAARKATTHEEYASIVQDLCARARGGAHLARKKVQSSRPQAGRGSGRISETLGKPHTHEKLKRQRMETPSASVSSGTGAAEHMAADVLSVCTSRGSPDNSIAANNATPNTAENAGQSTLSSASVIASLLQAAAETPNSQSGGHHGHVDNLGHDDVHNHTNNNHAERDIGECDHYKHDGHDYHACVSIRSIIAKAAPKLRRSCADENGCGRCFCETCYPL